MIGVVDGIILLLQTFARILRFTCILNLVTREYLVLQNYKDNHKVRAFGIGINVKITEYEVVAIVHQSGNLSSVSTIVYTLGTREWIDLSSVPSSLDAISFSDMLFLNNRCHWPIDNKDTAKNICSFDFDGDMFELSSPREI